jgi:hypothetical protein
VWHDFGAGVVTGPRAIDDLTSEIHGRLDRLEASLPSILDARDLRTRSQLPFYALYCREIWMWRVVELGRDAFDCFQKEDFVSAIVLTRAAMETSAALWTLRGKVEKALQLGSVNIGEFGRYLARLRVGQGKDVAQPDDPKAVHINDFIRAVEKDCKGLQQQYDQLSEFVHPNWSGTTGIYSRFDHGEARVEFGRNIRGEEGTKGRGLTNLSVALLFFEKDYNRFADLMPAFIELCEHEAGLAATPGNLPEG